MNRLDIYNNRGSSDQCVSVNKYNCNNNIEYRHIHSNNMAAYQHMRIMQTSEQILHSINNSINIGNHVNTSTNTAHRPIKSNLRFVNRNSSNSNNVVNRDNYNGSSNKNKISSIIINGNIINSTSTHTNSINNI